jgi:hypothetical protein
LGSVAGALFGLAAATATATTQTPPALRLSYAATLAVLGAVTSAISGCRHGSELGRLLDESVIAQWVCQNCGFIFAGPLREPSATDPPDTPFWQR